MNEKILLEHLRNIPDFPTKGIQFKDVSTLYKDAECLQMIVEKLYERYSDKNITKVVGIESRGFVVGAALAVKLGAGFVMCRKPGKLPWKTKQASYHKEYGEDKLEISIDAIEPDDTVLIHDDLLATGGSMEAAISLVKQFGARKIYAGFIIELLGEGLHGRESMDKEVEVTTLLKID